MPAPTAAMAAAPARTVSIAFVRSAVQALDAAGRAAVLAEAGIPAAALAQDAARVPAQAFATLWMAVARALDDEFFGLDARRMKVGTFAMLCHALAGQPTVGAALRLALRGFGLCFDDIGAGLRVQGGAAGGQASLVIDNRIGGSHTGAALADARRFADETLLVMLHGLLCWLAGRRVPLAQVDWAHAQPPHADEYQRMFAPLQRFGAPATAVSFDARVLAAAVTVTPASLKAFLRDAPQSVFLKQVVSTGLGDRAQRLCRSALDRGESAPTLAALGRTMGLTTATLRRRLDAEGAAWGPLKDAVRRDLALQLLAEGHLSVADIATRLGFEDASTFYRAFRKWTGCAPGAWRAAQGAAVAAG